MARVTVATSGAYGRGNRRSGTPGNGTRGATLSRVAEPTEAPRLRRATGFGIPAVHGLPHMSDLRALARAVRGHLPPRFRTDGASSRRITAVLAGLAVITVGASIALMAAGTDRLRSAPLASTTPFLSKPRGGGSVVVPDRQAGSGGSRPARPARPHAASGQPAGPGVASWPAVRPGHGRGHAAHPAHPAVRRPEDVGRRLPHRGRHGAPGRHAGTGWTLPAGWRFPSRVVPHRPSTGTHGRPPESAGTAGPGQAPTPGTGYRIGVRIPVVGRTTPPAYRITVPGRVTLPPAHRRAQGRTAAPVRHHAAGKRASRPGWGAGARRGF